MTNSLLLKMAIEIVDFHIKNGGSFHSYVNVYQRVNMMNMKWQDFLGCSHDVASM
jgi:hypothetical protein